MELELTAHVYNLAAVHFILSFNYCGRGYSFDEVRKCSRSVIKSVQNTRINVIYVNSC